PGCGAVAANERLTPFLPGPIVEIVEEPTPEEDAPLYGLRMPKHSIGQLKAFWGNFGMHVRAYAYIRAYGNALRQVSRHAVLNANYVRARLKDAYKIPYNRICAHEFVLEGHFDGIDDVHALDISKRLMDFGIHPPTNYFPLIVPEALLIEPTETEDKATLDRFIEAMRAISAEARQNPELLTSAPHTMPVARLDEVRAAKRLVLCCRVIPEWAEPEAGD
ncbi:MAG: aminomethyl-transferring glycine dehydrogenase subunit GcvPB, partial [Chloroflexi bacterium]|nr:aminomethyl-transferring glycine dehydrogenase subunit GcvPB [Chloroflexota bacterium]